MNPIAKVGILALCMAAAAQPCPGSRATNAPGAPVPPAPLEPATCYVDATRGDDTGDGSADHPFRTIQRAADAMREPGSACTIRAGVYRETVRFQNPGDPDKPLRFQAEPGAILSASDPVTRWIPSADDPAAAGPRAKDLYFAEVPGNPLNARGQIAAFVGGKIAPEARWPNDDGSYPWPTYAYCSAAGYDKDGRNGWIADTDLPDRPDGYWEGCRLIILAGHGWQGRDLPILRYIGTEKKIITDFENNKPGAPGNATLRGPLPENAMGRGPFEGNEYFIVANLADLADPASWIQNECDAPNEWAYLPNRKDPTKGRLYFKTAGGSPENVSIRARDVGLDFSTARHIRVTGLQLLGCRPIFGTASRDIRLEGMRMTHVDHQRTPGGEGIFIDGDHHLIRDCAIEWSAGNLVTFRSGRGHRFINNLVRGANYSTYRGGLLLWRGAENVLVSHCTLKDSGAMILAMHDAEGAIVEYCDIADGAKLCTDLGLKYDNFIGNYCLRYNLWHGGDSPNHTGHGSSAIYLEDGGAQAIVHHNIVWDVTFGIQLNSSSTLHRMFHNTIGKCEESAVLCGSNRQKMAVERFSSILANNILTGVPIQARRIGIRGLAVRANLLGEDPRFVDAANGDYRLRQDSPARDSGARVAGINDGVPDRKPDIGALEFGAPDWTREVGHDFGNPPRPEYRYPDLEYRTYTENYSFELPSAKGATPPTGWALSGSARRVSGPSHDRANILTDVVGRNGRFTIQISGSPGEVRQTVRGLKPATEYILIAGVRPGLENKSLYLGVENHGGETRRKEFLLPLPADLLEAQHGGGHWTMGALRFVTGPENDAADVFAGANAAGPEKVYVDTIIVVPASPWHNPTPEPVAIDMGQEPSDITKNEGGAIMYPIPPKTRAVATTENGGKTLHLSGNGWKAFEFDYRYTPLTTLEFDFKGATRDAIQGIGIGADASLHRAAIFLARDSDVPPPPGKKRTTGSLWQPAHTDPDGWEHYRIPLGLYLRYIQDFVATPRLILINESPDREPTECRFRNIRIADMP